MSIDNVLEHWNKQCTDFLEGKTIKHVRYMTRSELVKVGSDWIHVPLVIIFTDGSYIFPMRDDEGNDGGSLATSDKNLLTIPTISPSDTE